MKKQRAMILVLVSVLVNVFLVAPVSAGLLVSTQGGTILSRIGATSPIITVTDTDIPQDGNITIDLSQLASYVANGTLTDANVEVSDSAADATWTRQVEFDGSSFTLNLTSTGGDTHVDETVTVTFTGAAAGNSAWYCDTGDMAIDLTATRSDTLETSDTIIFLIYVTPGSGGLTTAPGESITATDGSTSMVLTVTGEPVLQNDLIFIPVWDLNGYVTGDLLTGSNVQISDNADAATWTGIVDADSILTLTSTGGDTAVDETVTVTFTGTGPDPWKAGATGNTLLSALRPDTNAQADFEFVINISAPAGYTVVANFTGSPTEEIAPFTVTFTDTSTGNPTSWDWDWGDGTEHGTTKNPSHIYTDPGIYTVSLTASNAYTTDPETKYQYITAQNGGVSVANTAIRGLTITSCEGPQTITVDTSVLPADLTPTPYVLDIQPPADSGFKKITVYAQNGIGFLQNGHIISGNPTKVHLVSGDIAPPGGFSNTIGTKSSFYYSIDLPSYPCNAVLSTKIREGGVAAYETKLQKVAAGQHPIAVPIGTAYTASINKTNFPFSAPVRLRMSVNASWNTIDGPLSGGPGYILIWRIADDGNSGQILYTIKTGTDPVNNLDHFEADSPLGMSTFGISSFTGNNNPFQLITLAISSYIEPQNAVASVGASVMDEAGEQVTPSVTATNAPTATPAPNPTTLPPRPPEGITANLYTNAEGVITQATTIKSADGFVTVSVGTGTVVKDPAGKPLTSLTLSPVAAGNLPGNLPGGTITFAGRACELQPDGAVFSPGISLIFTVPLDARIGQDFSIKFYDRATGTWQNVPTIYSPATGTITGEVTHFCTFALFAGTTTPTPSATTTVLSTRTAALQPAASPPTSVSTAVGIVEWIVHLLAENMLLAVAAIILVAGVLLYEWKQRRGSWK